MSKLENMRAEVIDALLKLERGFVPEMKLTFTARHPSMPECWLIITSDDLVELAKRIASEATK